MPKFKVGDRVCFNAHGLKVVFGSTIGCSHMRSKVMVITHVDPESITSPEQTHIVEVDDPEINQFMIYDHCFNAAR